MPTVAEALRVGTARLAAAGVPAAARDARLLMAGALGVAPERVSLATPEPLAPAARAAFEAMVAARARRQPVAQITGRRAFWGRDFEVTPDVLDPRPETETIVALALAGAPAATALDLGTGSGALLVTLLAEWPAGRGTGTDRSAAALAVAARNAARHGVADRATFVETNWTDGVRGAFEFIVCNPPYIPAAELARLEPDVRDWEPAMALTPGPTGLEAYCALAPRLVRLLAPGGRALLEFGAGQAPAVVGILREAGLPAPVLHRDLDGRERVAEVTAPA
jgi:release factor glutamine methyltransferase